MEDNWKNRNSGRQCDTCIYYIEKEREDSSNDYTVVGRCRRHAPTLIGYPVVFETDWCGDYKLDEEKIE